MNYEIVPQFHRKFPSLSSKSSSHSTSDILVEGCEDQSLVDQDEHCLKGGAQADQKEAKDQVGTLWRYKWF
jgi:hypothetical protein